MTREAKATAAGAETAAPEPPVAVPVRDRSWRPFMIAGALLIVAAGFAMAHSWSPHADLRVTTGPPGSTAQRFIAAFVSVSEAQHPRVHLKLVQVDDLAASGKALEGPDGVV